MLSTLKVHSMIIRYSNNNDVQNLLDPPLVMNYRLKVLCVNMSISVSQGGAVTAAALDRMELTNRILQLLFIQSCPNLEKFELQGEISLQVSTAGSSLHLPFINHHYIKEVRLCLGPCRYYSLNGSDLKYVSYHGDKIIKYNSSSSVSSGQDGATNNRFHIINLEYGSKAIRLALLKHTLYDIMRNHRRRRLSSVQSPSIPPPF